MEKWIKWNGGENPCGFWDRVKVILFDGTINEGDSNCFAWNHVPESDIFYMCNIGAYMIIEKDEES